MREIKFRAWFEGHMYEIAKLDFWGDPDQATCDMARMSLNEDGYEEEFEVYLHEVELMQYTGLKDKNGKEIYEGDIVKTEVIGVGLRDCKVIYDDYEQRFMAVYGTTKIKLSDSMEVIGNIYENPELLK